MCTATGDQMGGAVATSSGRAIAVWVDGRSGINTDLYAMEVGEPATAVRDDLPAPFHLGGNAPNPFADETEFDLELALPANVDVDVFDVAGRRVGGAHHGRLSSGAHALRVAARDLAGAPLASGVYFCRVTAGSAALTRKMVIAR